MLRPAEQAYRVIHERIVNAAYPPGYHLKEEQLSASIGVSRTPVREALRRLATEGLVTFARNQGTFVESFTVEDIKEVFSLRAMLEAYGAGKAAERITDEQIARLVHVNKQLEGLRGRPLSDAAVHKFSRLNTEFHKTILAASGSRRLAAILVPVIDVPLILLKHYNWRAMVDIERSCAQHRELVAALGDRDAEMAKTLMRAHVLGARGDFLSAREPRKAETGRRITL